MDARRNAELLQMVRELFPLGSSLGYKSSCAVVDVRERPGEAMLLVRWDRDPHLYGIPISLTDTQHEFYYSDFAVSTDEEWLDSVHVGLGVMLDTGHRATARRTQVDDYIELSTSNGWPDDDRFYLQDWDPDEGRDHELIADGLREDGLDPTLGMQRRAEERLIAWMVFYENNASGGPWVGQAVVSERPAGGAELELIETAPGVPATVRVDLAYFAAHSAAEGGALTVTTKLADPNLALAGFVEAASGDRALDTSFLKADPDGARALLEVGLSEGSGWGQDRDAAGRYLPTSRLGRLRHRLRWGRSGGRPRTFAV